jgi:hypothetical protein
VAGCFLGELHPGGQAEFGVDVGGVGLHRPRRDEKPCGDDGSKVRDVAPVALVPAFAEVHLREAMVW